MPSSDKPEMINADDVKTIVRRAFKEPVDVVDYQLIRFSKDTVGFLGTHRNLEVTINRSNSDESEKHVFFAKSLPQDSERMSDFAKKCRVFNQEAKFYNEMMPRLLEDYKDELWGPKCYLATEEVVVLEDLRAKGFAMRENRTFDGEHLRSAARALARMHACSVLAERRAGRPLKDVCPEACAEQIFSQQLRERGLFRLLLELTEKIAREHGRSYGGLGSAFDAVFERVRSSKDKNQVISHADTWCNNFMFSGDEPPKCLLIDFQLARYANRMWDVAQLVYYTTTKDIRMKEEPGALGAYHEEFSEVLRKHDSALILPSLSDAIDEYEEARLPALFATMFYYPFMLVKKEEYLYHKDNIEAMYDKYIFRLNNEAVFNYMRRDEEYKCRITETALELVDYCEKLSISHSKGI